MIGDHHIAREYIEETRNSPMNTQRQKKIEFWVSVLVKLSQKHNDRDATGKRQSSRKDGRRFVNAEKGQKT